MVTIYCFIELFRKVFESNDEKLIKDWRWERRGYWNGIRKNIQIACTGSKRKYHEDLLKCGTVLLLLKV